MLCRDWEIEKEKKKVPLYALLLFGGHIAVDHVRGGLTVGGRTEGTMRLRAWPRIAILVQQLRCVHFPVPAFSVSNFQIHFALCLFFFA
jgi:hypothetical protein